MAAAEGPHPTAMLSIIIASGPAYRMIKSSQYGASDRHPIRRWAKQRPTEQCRILVVSGDGEIDLFQGRRVEGAHDQLTRVRTIRAADIALPRSPMPKRALWRTRKLCP